MKIRQIIDKIDDNQLFVPAFQREYVWKRNDAKHLIHSLIKDYPTGTMLTWETNTPELSPNIYFLPTYPFHLRGWFSLSTTLLFSLHGTSCTYHSPPLPLHVHGILIA